MAHLGDTDDPVRDCIDREVLWWHVRCVESGGHGLAERLKHEARKRFIGRKKNDQHD